MATITGQVKHAGNFNQHQTTGLPGSLDAAIAQNWQFQVANSGTAADQADLKYTKTLSLAAAAQTLDLTALTDVFGGTVNFARVRSIAIRVKSTTDGQTLTVGAAASNAWTGILGTTTSTLIVPASTPTNDAYFVLTAPNTTGAAVSGTSKSLKLDPGAATFTVEIEITGASA